MSMNLCGQVTYPAGASWPIRDPWSSEGLVQTPTRVTYRILGVSQRALDRARKGDPTEYDRLIHRTVEGLQPCLDRYLKWRQEHVQYVLQRIEEAVNWDSEDFPTPEEYAKFVAQRREQEATWLRDQLSKALQDGAVITWRAG